MGAILHIRCFEYSATLEECKGQAARAGLFFRAAFCYR